MTDKEIWKKKFKNQDVLERFETKPGPTVSKKVIIEPKILKEQKEQKRLEKRLDEVTKELSKLKKILKITYFRKPPKNYKDDENQNKQERNNQQVPNTDQQDN